MAKSMIKKTILSLAVLMAAVSIANADSASPVTPAVNNTAISHVSSIEVRVCGGMVSPVSDGLYQYFKADYSFGGSLGYKLDDQFSLLLDCQYNALEFAPGGISPVKVSNFSTLELAVLEKLRVGSNTKIKPFFFLGQGVAFTKFSNPIWENESNEIDPMAEVGLGMDFAMMEQFSVFLQTKVSMIITSDKVSPDSPTFYIPIQAGVDFSL
jgi:hypothetical protein